MRIALCAVALIFALPAAPAMADGLPLVDVGTRPDGIADPDAEVRYSALRAGDETVIARIATDGGRVLGSRRLPGRLAVPAVAYDGTAGGLAADGRTLALITPRRGFPRHSTSFTLLDHQLRVRERISLQGDFSFDAIAPDGRTLFLVEYPRARNPAVYRVRMYDVARKRLLAEPLLDSRTAPVVMRGWPITRATDPEGQTAYTLYDGLGEPFIHALDTVQRSALCILLPQAKGIQDPSGLTLDMAGNGTTITVRDWDRAPIALVDTETASARTPLPRFGGFIARAAAAAQAWV